VTTRFAAQQALEPYQRRHRVHFVRNFQTFREGSAFDELVVQVVVIDDLAYLAITAQHLGMNLVQDVRVWIEASHFPQQRLVRAYRGTTRQDRRVVFHLSWHHQHTPSHGTRNSRAESW
jgi:hypothetical protein